MCLRFESNCPLIRHWIFNLPMLPPVQIKNLGASDCCAHQVEVQLQESTQVESVIECPEGLAHEFNNLLTIIIGNCDLLMFEHGLDQIPAECAEEIKKAAERAVSLASQLITLSQRNGREPVGADLDPKLQSGF